MSLSKEKRAELDKLSLEAFGMKNQWQKLLKKGEYVPENTVTSSGATLAVKRWQVLTLESIEARMAQILKEKEERLAAAKVEEEAKKAIEAEKTV